ncbi:UvrD-helicase domain-containing protein [Cyanobium sp. Aljojuca 7D2]|uniref:UvrD-helicase domain-containing protein n=1 Tax=Cyanobium sp. Aljojuca 7D2 TaxID=2823698 RepID=UPI0020CEF846|nr:UvrD-helicase domain-containing protein [Cyanobium sp. Aljojuca 7D2]MCP9890933.1 UvrD-helicase domain-containing protein [Cyanobium sp. Aljojuca 7D2]
MTHTPKREQPFEANGFPLEPGIRLLEASAGTGKTFALAQLVLRYVGEAELGLRQLLVVTFTEAAAAELRDRIGQRLQLALSGLEDPAWEAPDPTLAAWLERQRPRADSLRARLLLALEELDAADITTIHGFCRRTLQRQALEAGLPPELQLEDDQNTLVRQVAHDYWQRQVLPLDSHLLAGLQQRVQGPELLEQLLRQLDGDPALQLDPLPPQLQADAPLAPQLTALWAEAWSGFQQLWAERGRALEAAFCAAAAQWRGQGVKTTTPYSPKPTKDRCALVETWIAAQPPGGDYGATAGRQGGAGGLLRDYFHPGTFLKLARGLDGSSESPEPSLPERALLEAIAQLLDGPAEALLLHACHWGRGELNRRRRQSGRLGFAQLLEGLDPGELASTPLLQAVGERYAVALIDEFQDTDPIQWRILSRAFQPERHRLVMVGDPKQAIYRFRGGELATYLRARATASQAGGISNLTDNYRSSEALISGLNALMHPGLRRSGLAVPQVHPRMGDAGLVLPAGQHPLQLLWLGGERQAGQKPPSRSALERQLHGQIASFTASLLNRGLVEQRPNGSRPLGPNDICLLVSTHRQAEALRGDLEACGIASRLVSQGDVLDSAGATALQRLLDALAEPGRANRLRLLAASPLLGWSAAQIAGASPEDWSSLAARLAQLAQQLPRRGLLGVLASLLEQRGLARLSLGGRLLADLQQCAALVAERLHADKLGPAAAADWLRRRRLEPDRDVPEAHQPHSDVVDAAVSVVTVHRSKGLEYPVVICPYLWQAPGDGRGTQRIGVRWQPGGSDPLLDLHLNGHWGAGFAARQHQLQAELQERERLAYVAATRARLLLVLAWGPAQGQQGNPLHPWLFDQDEPPAADHDPYAGRSDADWRERLEQALGRRHLPLTLLDPPNPGERIRLRASHDSSNAPLARGPVPRAPFDTTWGRSSYTSWTQGSHSAAPAALEEGRETDALVAELDASAEPGGEAPQPWPDDGPLAAFPRGAQAGDCLHRILEQLDYRQPVAAQAELCARELQRAGIAEQHGAAAVQGLEQLRQAPLGGALGNFQLAQLAQGDRLNEMNFDLPLSLVRARALARPFADHPEGWFGMAYAEQLAQLDVASQGFLTGSIDLVFRHGERWWVADWKSNWLGERDAQGQPLHCGPRHYSPGAMAALMAANHYPLQAHLYLVALHRYLRWRLPGYRPDQHLGGYVYVFLRGVPGPLPPTATGSDIPGMFVEQPPLVRLLQLDRALGGTP